MRRLAAVAALLWLCAAQALGAAPGSGAAPAAGAQDGPQARCGANWLPAFTFASGEGADTPRMGTMARDVVRLVRGCRYGQLRVVAFVRGNPGEAWKRAQWVKAALTDNHWPAERIAVAFRPKDLAPHGHDSQQDFVADAIVEFAWPDPLWHADRLQQCTPKAACAPAAAPQWIREPWPSLGIHMPIAFFAADSAALSPPARSVIAEGARRFKEENCRLLPVEGLADNADADPDGIALKRAAAVRDELVRLGVDPGAIPVTGGGTGKPIVPPRPGVAEPMNRRAELDCVD